MGGLEWLRWSAGLGVDLDWRGPRSGYGALAPTLTDATFPFPRELGATGLLASYGLPFMAKGRAPS